MTIIGNLVRDPELRTTTTGKNVCTFTVAVNRKRRSGEESEADFFRVTAWDGKAEICSKYLQKGKKVCVIGPVRLHTYTNAKGENGASLEVQADDLEFLSQREEQMRIDPESKMQQVDPDDLPY